MPDLVENFDEVSKNEAATEDAKISDVTGGHRYIINLSTFSHCCGSIKFVHGSVSADPYRWLINPDSDPDPQHCFFDEVTKNEAVTWDAKISDVTGGHQIHRYIKIFPLFRRGVQELGASEVARISDVNGSGLSHEMDLAFDDTKGWL